MSYKPSSDKRLCVLALSAVFIIAACNDSKSIAVQYPANNADNDTYEVSSEWQLVWADEFEGEQLNAENWNRQVEEAGRFNQEWQRYTDSPENSYVENGHLVLKAIHESDTHGHDQYTSARLNTAQKQSWKYGKIAARIQLPYGEGMWPAFWMLGTNITENGGDTPWPQSGEIDILELYGSKNDAIVEANIHYADTNNNHAMLTAPHWELAEGKFADAFHVFEIEWDEAGIRWLVDGNEYAYAATNSDERTEFQEAFFILLNIAVGGEWAGRPDNSTSFPQYMYVDWVRAYQKATN